MCYNNINTDDNNDLYLDNTFQNRVTNSHQQRNNCLYNTVEAVKEINLIKKKYNSSISCCVCI